MNMLKFTVVTACLACTGHGLEDGTYGIQHKKTKMYMSAFPYGGHRKVLLGPLGQAEPWIVKASGSYVMIQQASTGWYLDSELDHGVLNVVVKQPSGGADAQLWILDDKAGDGTLAMFNKGTDKYMYTEGTPPMGFMKSEWTGGDDEEWIFIPVPTEKESSMATAYQDSSSLAAQPMPVAKIFAVPFPVLLACMAASSLMTFLLYKYKGNRLLRESLNKPLVAS